MEELVVSAHEFESFSKWYRYREPVVSGCVQGVSSTRNIHKSTEHRETEEMPEVTERTLERGLNKRTGVE